MTYTPNADFNGTDTFTYTITDADGDTSTATVTITVTRSADLEIDKIDRQDSASERGGKKPSVIRIDYDLCEYTGVCSQVCPEDVHDFRNGQSIVIKPDDCTECWICVENCVSGAIEIG